MHLWRHAPLRAVSPRAALLRAALLRAVLVLAALVLAACAPRVPVALRASSAAAPAPLTGSFAGTVLVDGDVLTLQLDTAEVRYAGLAPGDPTLLEEVTVRAVIATDSAQVGIPLGASGTDAVADALQPGERRALGATRFDLPLPPGARLRDLWVAFQLRGTARPGGREPELVIAYACSATNLFGSTTSAKARARRMTADYASGCRL